MYTGLRFKILGVSQEKFISNNNVSPSTIIQVNQLSIIATAQNQLTTKTISAFYMLVY